jgi:hypothetical protein
MPWLSYASALWKPRNTKSSGFSRKSIIARMQDWKLGQHSEKLAVNAFLLVRSHPRASVDQLELEKIDFACIPAQVCFTSKYQYCNHFLSCSKMLYTIMITY